MINLKCKTKTINLELEPSGQFEAVVVIAEGSIEASTMAHFQKAIHVAIKKGSENIVIDLEKVNYTTSTGIGALIKYNGLFRKRGGTLSILSPSDEVKDILDLMGVSEIIPIYDNIEAISKNFNTTEAKIAKRGKLNEQQNIALKKAETSLENKLTVNQSQRFIAKNAPIILASPNMHFFFEVLTDKLSEKDMKFFFAHTAEDAEKLVIEHKAAILLVDYTINDYESLCFRLKMRPSTSSCSIIRVYPKGKSPEKTNQIAITPNEFVIEPCSVDQVVSFISSEIKRVQTEVQENLQEIFFSCVSSPEIIQKAITVLEKPLSLAFQNQKKKLIATKSSIREALDNCRRHGHHGKAKVVSVIYICDKSNVRISIKDSGDGFNHKKEIESIVGKDTESLAQKRDLNCPGGLGIPLMLKSCDQVVYNDKGNEVTLVSKRV